MAELRLKIPDELEKEIEERLAELKLERSKAFRKLLLSVFNRMAEEIPSSHLKDVPYIALSLSYGIKVFSTSELIAVLSMSNI